MKRPFLIVFVVILVVSLTACGNGAIEPNPGQTISNESAQQLPPDEILNTDGTQEPISPLPEPEDDAAPSPSLSTSPPASPSPDLSTGLPTSPSPDPLTSPAEEPSPGPSTSPTEAPSPDPSTDQPGLPAPTPDDGPVILTIRGDGVSGETTWTLGQLQAMRDGYREITYSATNNWPTYSHVEAHGISMAYLFRQAGMLGSAASFTFIATDGYRATLTYDQVFGTRYSYINHSSEGSCGALVVEPLIAWEWGSDGRARPENICPYFGQISPQEVNTSSFVKDLYVIEVSTASAGRWDAPEASIADGSTVPVGTELELLHGNRDSIRIYYTINGSEPDYASRVYNLSTSYFQPQLIVPIYLAETVTIRAFAAGIGKDASAIATFTYTVE